MTRMTPRRRAVLGLVIRSYIETRLPVGSKAFVDGYGLDVSPATIRNEMAVLEEMGYLTHPHTSAGRVPTEQGYRFFVEHLVGETELPLVEQLMIRHQFHQAAAGAGAVGAAWRRPSGAYHAQGCAGNAPPPRPPASSGTWS